MDTNSIVIILFIQLSFLQVSGGVAGSGTEEEAGKQAPCVTISCPACRTLVPVPPGGVGHFQVRLTQRQLR